MAVVFQRASRCGMAEPIGQELDIRPACQENRVCHMPERVERDSRECGLRGPRFALGALPRRIAHPQAFASIADPRPLQQRVEVPAEEVALAKRSADRVSEHEALESSVAGSALLQRQGRAR